MAITADDGVSAPRPDREPDDGPDRMTLVEHLAELRARVVKSIIAIGVAAVVMFAFYDPVLEWMIRPYCDVLPAGRDCTLVITAPLEGIAARFKVAGYGGLFIASPVVLWQLWRFVTPGLHKRERRYAIPFILASVVLFASGATLGVLTFPKALGFVISFAGENVTTLFSPEKYVTFLLRVMLGFAISFEFPILLVFLQLAGVLEPRTLGRYRRHAIVAIFAFDAVITPTQDPLTLLAMAVPMYAFYEASILIGKLLKR